MADVRDGGMYKIVNVKWHTVIDLNSNDNRSSAYNYMLLDEPLQLEEFYQEPGSQPSAEANRYKQPNFFFGIPHRFEISCKSKENFSAISA
jgi:hypothetical protein